MRATQSRYIALCLMKEQKNPVKKWHFICTHKYTHTQSRKGRPSPRFSPFAYFPISHNTNQTAKLTRPPNKSAILRVYRRAPWQHQLNEAFGMPAPLRTQAQNRGSSLVRSGSRTDSQAPATGDGIHTHTEQLSILPTRLPAWVHKKDLPSPTNLPALYRATKIYKIQKLSGTLKSGLLMLSMWFATKLRA